MAILCFQPIYEMQRIKWPAASASAGGDTTHSQPAMWSTHSSAAAQSSAALSSNLSELDNLLQELSSAQFAVEVDRRSTGSCLVKLLLSVLVNQISDFPAPFEVISVSALFSLALQWTWQ